MPQFRKKPVEIEARQLGRDYDEDCAICGWCGARPVGPEDGYGDDALMVIPTREGQHVANVDDWVIKGVAGEFYPCKPDIFALTYEAAP